MYFPFESTQSRGNRIQGAMDDLGWGDLPEDGLILKEDDPHFERDDLAPVSKPNIKSTMRQWMELREEVTDEDGHQLSERIDQMEIERLTSQERPQEIEQYQDEDPQDQIPVTQVRKSPVKPPVKAKTPTPRRIERVRKEIIRPSAVETGYNPGNVNNMASQLSQQNQQSSQYVQKLAKALTTNIPKGKTKASQKFNYYPSSSSFFEKKKKFNENTQMSTAVGDIPEDIDDLEDVTEGGVYVSNIGQKNLRVEVNMETTTKSQAMNKFSNPSHHVRDSREHEQPPPPPRDSKEHEQKGLQGALERALRRLSNQQPTKWLVRVVSYKSTYGINSVEFVSAVPNQQDTGSCYAIINSAKQYYAINITPDKKYFLINPRPIVDQEINGRRVFYVEKVEEAVN